MGTRRAKTADHGLERSVSIAEAVSDVGQRSAVDKVGAQSLVTALQRLVGLEEELAARLVVHDGSPKG